MLPYSTQWGFTDYPVKTLKTTTTKVELISENLQKWVPNYNPEHLFFRWIMLRIGI